MLSETMKEFGIDYDGGLVRCMNDADFYSKLLSMFLEDDSLARAEAAYGRGDYAALFACLHELKGISGTASLTALYDEVCPFVELVRGGAMPDRAEADRRFEAVRAAYARVCEGIRALLSSER